MDIQTIIAFAKPVLQKHNIKKAALFGSIVRGNAKPTSDVDVLIDPPEKFSLFDRAGLKVDLEDVLDRQVDVVLYQSIKPLLRDSILKYEYPIF